MINPYPHELSIGDVYFSPTLLVVVLALFMTSITVVILNRVKLSRYFYLPSYIFLAIVILYIVLIDTIWIKF